MPLRNWPAVYVIYLKFMDIFLISSSSAPVRFCMILQDFRNITQKTGGDLFLQLGYPEISQIISQHHGLKETKLDETAIVFLADKLIEETQRVSIEKRFADNLHKCKSPEAMKSHERQLKQARALQDMIQSICYITL